MAQEEKHKLYPAPETSTESDAHTKYNQSGSLPVLPTEAHKTIKYLMQ